MTKGRRKPSTGSALDTWLVVSTSDAVESLKRSALAIAARWPGKYRFLIREGSTSNRSVYELCLRHR